MSESNNYWNQTGKYTPLFNAIWNLVPRQGEVQGKENKALEKMRKANGAYYDLFNNGLGNRAAQFRAVFGFGGTPLAKHFNYEHPDMLKLEALMDKIILEAWEEQKGKIIPAIEVKIEEAKQTVLKKARELETKPLAEKETLDGRLANLGFHCKILSELKNHLYTCKNRLEREAKIEEEFKAKKASL